MTAWLGGAFCFAALYLFHLILYYYNFSEEEGLALKDYERYLMPYLQGWVMAALCLLAPLLPAERALLMQQQEQLDQQSRLNEAIQVYKAQQAERSRAGIHEREKALLEMTLKKANLEDIFLELTDTSSAEEPSDGQDLSQEEREDDTP